MSYRVPSARRLRKAGIVRENYTRTDELGMPLQARQPLADPRPPE